MMKTSELELIMAYHDGELPSEQRAEAEHWLDTRLEARAYLQELEATDRYYREGFGALLKQQTVSTLAEGLGVAAPTPNAEGVTGKLIRFPFQGWFQGFSGQNWALAASLALVLVFGGGWWLQFQQDAGQPALAQILNRALETTPSGEVYRAVYQGAEVAVHIMPLASYHTERQGFCREYAGRYRTQQLFGLACRGESGTWTPVFEESNELNPNADIYLPASGRKDRVAQQLDAVGAGDTLTPEQEAQLLSERWR